MLRRSLWTARAVLSLPEDARAVLSLPEGD